MNILNLRPPQIAGTCLLISIGLHYLVPDNIKLKFTLPFLGRIMTGLGFVIMIFGWSLFKKNGTPLSPAEKPTAFVVAGPYRFSRNPMYLGMVLILSGIAFYMGSLMAFVGPLVFLLIINNVFIPYEEAKMEKIFGQEYLDYKKQVRRWL